MTFRADLFIPGTREIAIGDGVKYRPIRSWHSGTYAGERLRAVNGDGSGCVRDGAPGSYSLVTSPPCTVTHRLYWHESNPESVVSAFLSYPHGMGHCDSYFWEANVPGENDCIQRFAAEDECEAAIRAHLQPKPQNTEAV